MFSSATIIGFDFPTNAIVIFALGHFVFANVLNDVMAVLNDASVAPLSFHPPTTNISVISFRLDIVSVISSKSS